MTCRRRRTLCIVTYRRTTVCHDLPKPLRRSHEPSLTCQQALHVEPRSANSQQTTEETCFHLWPVLTNRMQRLGTLWSYHESLECTRIPIRSPILFVLRLGNVLPPTQIISLYILKAGGLPLVTFYGLKAARTPGLQRAAICWNIICGRGVGTRLFANVKAGP